MKNILVPTDFSPNAANALTYAIHLAQLLQGQIILFHNSEISLGYAGTNIYTAGDVGFGAAPLYPGGVFPDPELEKLQEEKLNQLARQVGQQFQNSQLVQTAYRAGSFTENLNQIIKEYQVHLVVMGTQGASTLLDRFIGTNTASVIKEVHGVPVLAIPAGATFTVPKHIAYAADLADDNGVFLSQLLGFAEPIGAEITLVHIKSADQVEIINEELFLAELHNRFPGLRLQLVERSGETVAKGLENFIHQNPIDLLAIGFHEHGFWHSLFHSSVTEQLVFQTDIPLLTLPEKPVSGSWPIGE